MPTTMHQEPFSGLAFENLLLYASFPKTPNFPPKIQFRGKSQQHKTEGVAAITGREIYTNWIFR